MGMFYDHMIVGPDAAAVDAAARAMEEAGEHRWQRILRVTPRSQNRTRGRIFKPEQVTILPGTPDDVAAFCRMTVRG